MASNNHSIFSFFFRTRVKIWHQNTPILNLSLLFAVLTAISAPWMVLAGAFVALAMGYRFRIERNATEFSDDWATVVHGAAQNVRNAMDSIMQKDEAQASTPTEDNDLDH